MFRAEVDGNVASDHSSRERREEEEEGGRILDFGGVASNVRTCSQVDVEIPDLSLTQQTDHSLLLLQE